EPAPVLAQPLPCRAADEVRPQERAHRAAVEGDPRCGEGVLERGRLLDGRRCVRGDQPVVLGGRPRRPLPPLRPRRDYWSSFQTTLPPTMVPSRSASTTARRSASQRSGGFNFVDASYPESFTAWSVRRRWCGVASAVTRTPRAFPRRTASAPAAVLRWATCNRPPVSSAS